MIGIAVGPGQGGSIRVGAAGSEWPVLSGKITAAFKRGDAAVLKMHPIDLMLRR